MKRRYHCAVAFVLLLVLLFVFAGLMSFSAAAVQIPIKGIVTMVDLGAKRCIPCKMMAPILQKLERQYKGRAVIVFLDVWEDPEPAYRFGIRTIPTQIFFDKQGQEVYRHEGFMNEAEIVDRLHNLGVN